MGFSLKKLLEGAAAQVNMNDGGKTFATVVRNQPAQSQPAKTPPPSYGSNPVKQAINRTRDVFDANTPQDRFKRQLAQKPVIDFTAQDRARQKLNSVKNVAGNYAKGFVESYNQAGTGLGTLLAQNSADVKNAQKAQNNLADQLHQQRMTAIKTAKNPNLNDVQRNRLNNYYNSLDRADVDLQNSRTQQSNDLYSKLDPKKNLAAIGSVGFDIATLGVGTGGTQAVKQAFKSGIKTGAKELGGQMVKTGSLGAVSGGLSPIVQKGDQATAKDILQGAGMGFAMGATLPAVAPAVKFGGSKVVNTVKGLTKENLGAISPKFNQSVAMATPDGQIVRVPRNINENIDRNFAAKRVTPDGNRYVELDRQLLNNAPKEQWSKIIRDNIAKKFQGNKYAIGGDEANTALVNSRSKAELSFLNPNLADNTLMQKGNMTDNLDELINTMHDIRRVANKKPAQKPNVDHYISGRVPVQVGDTTLYPRVDIEVSKNGSMAVYDIADIKEFPGWNKVVPNRGDQFLIDNQETRSGNIVPQNTQNVNPIRGLDRFKTNQKGFARSTEESPVLKKLGIVKDGKAMSVDPLEALKAEARKNGEVIVYHRTSKANADQIMKTGKMFSKENTGEIFTSNRPDGQISGYGDTVVPIRVKKSDLRLDDEFPTGEKHFAIKSNKATPVTDLYNQAKGAPIEKTPLDTLKQEALKYKTADEFVKNLPDNVFVRGVGKNAGTNTAVNGPNGIFTTSSPEWAKSFGEIKEAYKPKQDAKLLDVRDGLPEDINNKLGSFFEDLSNGLYKNQDDMYKARQEWFTAWIKKQGYDGTINGGPMGADTVILNPAKFEKIDLDSVFNNQPKSRKMMTPKERVDADYEVMKNTKYQFKSGDKVQFTNPQTGKTENLIIDGQTALEGRPQYITYPPGKKNSSAYYIRYNAEDLKPRGGAPIEKTAKQLQVQQTPFGPVKAITDPGLDPVVHRAQKAAGKQQKSETLLPESKPTSKTPAKDSEKASYSNDTPDQNELPLYKTHRVSNLDKAFRSTRSIIERQGEKGKKLASMLQEQRDTKELYVRDLEKRIPTVQSLKGKDYENFVDATQGLAKPNNPKVAQAVKEWQSVHPEIRDRAVKAGLDVGDLGETYYPHFVDYDKIFKDRNTYNEAINHLVKTGQADTPEKAIELLTYARDVSRNRKFGNLEASRLVDLPFYDKSKSSLGMYIDGSADRITKTEMFGKGDENALKLIKEAGSDGYDTEAMKNAYDVAVGAKQHNPTTSKISKGIRQFTTTTRLGLGALTNVSQSVNTGIVTGHLRTMKSIVKQLDPKTRKLAEDTGVISDAILNDLKHGFGAEYNKGKFGKLVNVITAPGFKQVESFNRRVAATAGRDYALRLAQKGDETTLRKLGVSGAIKNNTLTDAQQIQAARKIVEKTQFKVDPQDLPGWTDSPGGKLVAQFRTFSYNQGKFFSNEILKPLSKGNIMPLGRLLAALPLGYGLYEIRRNIDGRPEEENKVKVGLQSFQKIGGAGLVLDIYQGLNPVGSKYLPSDRRVTMAFGTIGGPSIGTAGNAVGAISEAIQRKNTPTDEKRLDGKVVVGKTPNSYTDLTSLSRFGMQQIPVFGTALSNRVLPYKKQAEAEAGRPLSTNSQQLSREDQLKDAKNSIKYGAGKEWQNLSEEDIKNKAIAGDQTAAGIYKSLQTMEKVYGPKNIPTPGLSTAAENVLNQSKKITKEGESAWGSRPTENKGAQKAISQLAGEELQVDNATAEKWAKYERDRVTGKINELDKVKVQRDILKSAYSSTLSPEEKKYFSYNDNDLLNALQSGNLKPDSLAKAMSVDAQLVAKGLITTSGFGKKVWNALGLAYPSVKGSSTRTSGRRTSGRRVASKKLKTTKTISLDTFKKYKTRRSSTNASLRKLLGSAKV